MFNMAAVELTPLAFKKRWRNRRRPTARHANIASVIPASLIGHCPTPHTPCIERSRVDPWLRAQMMRSRRQRGSETRLGIGFIENFSSRHSDLQKRRLTASQPPSPSIADGSGAGFNSQTDRLPAHRDPLPAPFAATPKFGASMENSGLHIPLKIACAYVPGSDRRSMERLQLSPVSGGMSQSKCIGETMQNIDCTRVQWPVGHGGFHTGSLKSNGADFHYFFDCGATCKTGKSLIQNKLEDTRFDFGVISHFDTDHYNKLKHANVGVLFLPYMTPADMIFLDLINKDKTLRCFDVLNILKGKGTRIIMVDGRDNLSQDEQQQQQHGLSLRFRARSGWAPYETIRHDEIVELRQGTEVLLCFKFFNFRAENVSLAFQKNLEMAVSDKKLTGADGNPYANVDQFLGDVIAGNAQVIHNNGKRLQEVYKQTLSENSPGGPKIDSSNLSSLTMSSNFPISSTITVQQYQSFRGDSIYHNGWMLTGDLELTSNVWPGFKAHYLDELSNCVLFNVPHHASKISLCDNALDYLIEKKFVLPISEKNRTSAAVKKFEHYKPYIITSDHALYLTVTWPSSTADRNHIGELNTIFGPFGNDVIKLCYRQL